MTRMHAKGAAHITNNISKMIDLTHRIHAGLEELRLLGAARLMFEPCITLLIRVTFTATVGDPVMIASCIAFGIHKNILNLRLFNLKI
jgi:hypothetical protein